MSVPSGFPPRWCTDHGLQLERVAREFCSRKLSTTAVKPKPPERRGPAKLPLDVRMQRVVEHVAANGPITREEAAKVAGLTSSEGSLVRILRRARELGLLETRRGPAGGVILGPNAPKKLARQRSSNPRTAKAPARPQDR